jgi:hypothetical protein
VSCAFQKAAQLIGIGVITLGFLLMSGGGSDDPKRIDELYSASEAPFSTYYRFDWFWNNCLCHFKKSKKA